MAKFRKKTNYWEKHPILSDDIIEVLGKSDRKMECQQYDLKVEQCKIDGNKQSAIYIPRREDSHEQLLEEKRQFAARDESVEDYAVKAVMIEKMLTSEEQDLIKELFFKGKSEHQLSKLTGVA